MGESQGTLAITVDGPAETGGVLRCTVRVNEPSGNDTIAVRLESAVIANGVAVHRHRWASANATRADGFEPGGAVALDIGVPLEAPASCRFRAGALEWTVEAVSGDVASGPTAAVITAGGQRGAVYANTQFEGGVSWFGVVMRAAIIASVLYPAVLVSQSIDSPWPMIVVGVLVLTGVGSMVIRARRKEPFPFGITESAVRPGGALQIELDGPASVTCTARLVTMVDRVESSGDYYDLDRRVIDGPITKIEPGVVRTVVAVPANTPPTSIVSLDSNTDIITRHFVEVDRFGAPVRSLGHTAVSRRSVDIRE